MPLPQARIIAVGALTATLLALAASPASARAAAATFALQPAGGQPYFVLDAAAGSVASGSIRVTNNGKKPGRARIYAVDATTGPTSGAAYLTEPRGGSRMAEWTHLQAGSVFLRPGESRVVPFTVIVPWGAHSGDYLGGITADPGIRRGRAVKHKGSSFRIDVRTLTVIAVQVRVPGPRSPGLMIDGVRAGGMPSYQQIFVGLRNDGNVLFKGSGSLVVRNEDGRVLKRSSFRLDTFVPDSRIAYPVGVTGKALPKGAYRATVTVHYAGRVVTRTFGFKVDEKALSQVYGSRAPNAGPGSGSRFPILAAAISVLVLLLLGVAGSWLWFRRRLRRLEARRREDDLRRLELWNLHAERAPDVVAPAERDD